MSGIEKIDKNFKIRTDIKKDDIKFYDAENPLFKTYGVYKEDGKYRRMPEKVAKKVSKDVFNLHHRTSGGRVKFVTNSKYIVIKAEIVDMLKMSIFALTGSAGFDLYADNEFVMPFIPPYETEDGYESIIEFEEEKEREITINMPLYTGVGKFYIGLQEGAYIKAPKPYINEKPIVFYGSSITQGGCATRPGMSYQNILSRKLNIDYINLGFSGSAKAEDEIAEYIKDLDMSIFVYDYDYNANTVEELLATHEKMFKKIREANKDLPIIMMSRPKYNLTDVEQKRLEIIKTTYENAINSGDKNVYLIDNKMLTAICKGDGTVDGCHPTDFGFFSMAQAVGDVIEKLI